MPVEWVLSDEDRRDLQDTYDLIYSFPHPSTPDNVECRAIGHEKVWVRLNSKMLMRKEYSNGPLCSRCHKFLGG